MNNRELAGVILLVLAVLLMLFSKTLRASIWQVLKVAAHPRLLIPIVALAAWIYLAVLGAQWLNLWDPGSAFSTVAWYFTGALAWFINISDAAKPGFIASRFRSLLALGLLVEFLANTYVLPLWAELLLQPLLVLLVMMSFAADTKPELAPAGRLINGMMGIVGLGLLAFALNQLVLNWATVDIGSLAKQFFLPIWLTLWTLPFVYAFAVYSGYESLFVRVRWHREDKKLRSYVVMGLMTTLGVSSKRVNSFRTTGLSAVARAGSLREVRQAVHEFELAERRDRNARRIARMRLSWYAGATGARIDGRLLDRREFAETKEALEWIAVCAEGHYGNRGRYPNLLKGVLSDLTGCGLPSEHGVTMRVRKDGQAWYAFRQTPSGYWFGVGVTRARGYRWYYDGRNKPTGFPARKDGWTDDTDETRVNWLPEDPT